MKIKTIPCDEEHKPDEQQINNIISWIAALRSGEYEQGRVLLFSNHTKTYCCLGVACEIKNIPKEDTSFIFDDIPSTSYPIKENGSLRSMDFIRWQQLRKTLMQNMDWHNLMMDRDLPSMKSLMLLSHALLTEKK